MDGRNTPRASREDKTLVYAKGTSTPRRQAGNTVKVRGDDDTLKVMCEILSECVQYMLDVPFICFHVLCFIDLYSYPPCFELFERLKKDELCKNISNELISQAAIYFGSRIAIEAGIDLPVNLADS